MKRGVTLLVLLLASTSAVACATSDLEIAITSRDVVAVKRAIDDGADVNKPFVHRVHVMTRILSGHGDEKDPPIIAAIDSGNIEIVSLLIDAGADIDARNVPWGSTPLISAASNDSPEIAKLLLKAGARVDDRDENGYTALINAASYANCETILTLLRAGADPSMDADMAIHHARGRVGFPQHHLVVHLLETWIALRSQRPEADTNPALSLLRHLFEGRPGDLEALARGVPEINSADQDGWTVLMWAASPIGRTDDVAVLLKHGAKVNEKTSEGWTALMSAAASDDVQRVELLLEAGAETNAADVRFSETPLMIAAERGSLDVVEALLKKGADALAQDKSGDTARDHAHMGDPTTAREAILARLKPQWPTKPEEIELAGPPDRSEGLEVWPSNTRVTGSKAKAEASGMIWLESPKLDIAFDIVWRTADREYVVGQIADRPRYRRSFQYSAAVPGFQSSHVDVVLRPNRDLALKELVDSKRIHGQETVFPRIRVERD